MRRALVQLRAVVLKEVRQTVRDRRMMAFIVAVPLIQLIVFGYAVDLDIDRVATVVVDLDQTSDSRRHVQRLLADGTLVEVARTTDQAWAEGLLEDGSANVVLVVPAGFGRALARGDTARVQVVVDGTNPNRSSVAASAVQRYFASAAVRHLEERAGQPLPGPGLTLAPRIRYNPSLRTPVFMVPGIAAILLIIVTTIVTAMGLAREREVGTLEQVLVTPLSPAVVILGKLIPFAVIGLFDFTLALTAGAWIFDMPIRGSLPLLYGATLLYLLVTLGAGLLVSSISGSQQQAFMAGFAIILPTILLSGIMTPIAAMPEWLRPVTALNPVRYYGEVLRSVLLKDGGVADLWFHLAALAVFGVVMITAASLRFGKQLR
jgi:ABC-2 type transport system permease protein